MNTPPIVLWYRHPTAQATLTSKIVSGGGIILDVGSRWVTLDAYLLLDGVLDLLVKCKAERPYCPFAY